MKSERERNYYEYKIVVVTLHIYTAEHAWFISAGIDESESYAHMTNNKRKI